MARFLLRLLGTRYGIALLLLALVVGVIGVARAVNGPRDATPVSIPPNTSTVTTSESRSDHGDDGVTAEDPAPAPSISAGAASPEAVALGFTKEWLKRDLPSSAWLQGLRPYSTANLMDLLRDADPATVPVVEIKGNLSLKTRESNLVDVAQPVTSGTLHLTLLGNSGRWLVDAVDWVKP